MKVVQISEWICHHLRQIETRFTPPPLFTQLMCPVCFFLHRFHHLLTLSLHPSIVSWQAGAFWQITQYFLSDLYPNPSPLPISQPPNLSLPIPEVPTYLKPSVVWIGKPNTCFAPPPPLFACDDDFDCPLRASSGLSGDLLTISY